MIWRQVRGRTGRWAMLALAVAAATVVAAACSGGSSGAGPDPTTAPTTTAPTTTTTTTTTIPTAPWPLTGLPTTDLAAVTQPAVVVKVDNSPQARPQSGLAQADVVYELLVEGITRYALVFHSEVADPVGPVRSARSSDIELLANLGDPVLGWSGGNAGVVGEVRAAQAADLLVDAGHDAAEPEYWRQAGRVAPHNLYTNVSALRAVAGAGSAGHPIPLFAHRPPGAPVPGSPVAGVTVHFGGGVDAGYAWDAAAGGWARSQVDQLHGPDEAATVDEAGVQVAPPNVVVLFVGYGSSPSDARSPMALTTGEGRAVVLTGGHLVEGSWSRPTAADGWALTDAAGAPIGLTPGKTWVALPRTGADLTVHELPPPPAPPGP